MKRYQIGICGGCSFTSFDAYYLSLFIKHKLGVFALCFIGAN